MPGLDGLPATIAAGRVVPRIPPSRGPGRPGRYHRAVAEVGQSLDTVLEELGAQLAWVRDYL